MKIAGVLLGDVVLTRDEMTGLTREYLYTERPVRGGADFHEWLAQESNAVRLGSRYESELERLPVDARRNAPSI